LFEQFNAPWPTNEVNTYDNDDADSDDIQDEAEDLTNAEYRLNSMYTLSDDSLMQICGGDSPWKTTIIQRKLLRKH
jgi:hypothetical protein